MIIRPEYAHHWQEHLSQRRGYVAALLESMPKPVQWKAAGVPFITFSHWHQKPVLLWQWMYGARMDPYMVEGRWRLRAKAAHLVGLALRYSQPYCVWLDATITDTLRKMRHVDGPPASWAKATEDIAKILGQPKDMYDGVPMEAMRQERLGYTAAVLERTKTWLRVEKGNHMVVTIRHHSSEVLTMIRDLFGGSGPNPDGARWVLVMESQPKIRRFLTIMRDFVIIPETVALINNALEGKWDEITLDSDEEM